MPPIDKTLHAINLLRTALPEHPVTTDYLKSHRHFRGPLSVTGTLTKFLRKTKRQKDKEDS